MKALTRLILAVMLVAAAGAVSARSRVHLGVHVGPYWGPWWAMPPPVYYAQPVVLEREAPIVIDQTVAPIDYWYFCRPANAYYPYVRDCPAPWERVPAKPAGQ